MIEISLKDIINSKDPLDKLLSEKMSARNSFNLSKLIDQVNKEYESFDKVRQTKIKEYGEESEQDMDGKKVPILKVKDENLENFSNDMSELVEQKIKLHVNKIKIDDLSSVNIDAKSLHALSWLIEE